MKAMIIEKYGENVPLVMSEQPLPTIGEHDVLVEIHAASLNPIDFKIKEGKMKFLLNYRFPLILGNDFSGVVVKVGARVNTFKPGDEVYGRPRKNRIGTLAEFIAVHEEDVWQKPKNLTFEEAASIPLIGLTTYQAFVEILNLQKGQKILIHAGSGGVGTFAIQLAKLLGAFVATTASEKGYELVKSLGADLIINYKKENFEEMLSGYDAVFDTLGGEALEKSFRILKPGGQIVSISGMPNGRFGKEAKLGWMKTTILSIASRKIKALEKKSKTRYHFLFMKPSGEQLRVLKEFIEGGLIKPIIDKVYHLKDAGQAFNYLESGRAKGKVVIRIK
ncbi:NADP-dependent oxidoreductase [Brevibacillus formosus]|uniref:NADPH:quinone reductase n=1 Tax=Brevibacillus formosus TaxID=54913 RepID=A0A837KFI3_9BACL|nr:NADP-dependent oxidoreductase [Brevibacillus formosus]KLH95872.1 NADPH:quinone reductase [Brevibacillus formosus]MED1955123.1 NADP-dependent oxidoreductase [Brevibacillus formosus]PSJ95005.1 NADP-dependent oxidoreductase [Brevibacillus formosus]GED61412.1 NADPH:quinone reductase [Brevibacillus formosus]